VTLYVYDLNSTERAGWDLSRNPKRVTVAGTTGWFTTSGAATALRWAYRPGGWAVILSGHGGVAGPPLPEQTLIRLAEAVRFTVAYPVTLPYRLSHLPADLHPFNVVQAPGSSPASVLQLSSAPERSDHTRIVDITVTAGAPAAGWQPSTRIAGRPARCTTFIDGRRCVVDFGTATVDIGQGSLSDSELAGIVAGVHLADVGSPRTWYALATALPGR
jgi:hypothetical protein